MSIEGNSQPSCSECLRVVENMRDALRTRPDDPTIDVGIMAGQLELRRRSLGCDVGGCVIGSTIEDWKSRRPQSFTRVVKDKSREVIKERELSSCSSVTGASIDKRKS